jgi:hypothetical protein
VLINEQPPTATFRQRHLAHLRREATSSPILQTVLRKLLGA